MGLACGALCWRQTRHSASTLYARQEQEGGKAYVPGSSLRGLFRNMMQIVGEGCGQDYNWDRRTKKEAITGPFSPCTQEMGLCMACRLFGAVRGQDLAWMGKVRVRDSEQVAVQWTRRQMTGNRDPGAGQGNGWILFRSEVGEADGPIGPLVCVPAGKRFPFAVEFAGLTADEMEMLQFVVTLKRGEEQRTHKLGFGKALGLGTVWIDLGKDEQPVSRQPSYLDGHEGVERLWQIL